MIDFFKNVLTGVTILIQSIGYVVGIKSDLPNFNNPSPPPIIIASPTPSSASDLKLNKDNSLDTNKKNDSKISNTVQNINSNEAAKKDGSRTGRIVKYKEYCKGGQEISVYESELITRKASDGNTYSMTKDDWDCSDKNALIAKNRQGQTSRPNSTLQNNTNSNPGEPIVDCILSYGTYQVYKSYCEQAKIEDQNIQKTSKEIAEERQRLNQQQQNQIPTQQGISEIQKANCRNAYETNVINANQFSQGLREFALQQAQSDYQRCLEGGSSEPIKITRPSPTPCEIPKGIGYIKEFHCP